MLPHSLFLSLDSTVVSQDPQVQAMQIFVRCDQICWRISFVFDRNPSDSLSKNKQALGLQSSSPGRTEENGAGFDV